jgi:glucose dehydrogenase
MPARMALLNNLAFGGAVATAGGLVFDGDISGYLNGLDAEAVETVWRDRAGKAYLGPPISFQVDGRQRIAVVSGRGVVVYRLPGGRRH